MVRIQRSSYRDLRGQVYIPSVIIRCTMFDCSAIGVDTSDPCASGCHLKNLCERRADKIRGWNDVGGIDEARCMAEHAWAFTTSPMLAGMG
jgi:hypothetical protein